MSSPAGSKKRRPTVEEICQNGTPVALINGTNTAVDNWVKMIARASGASMDWCNANGGKLVKFLGDAKDRARIELTITTHKHQFDGQIKERFPAPIASETASPSPV